MVYIHDWIVQSLQGVNRLLDFHKLAAVITLIDWPRKILDFFHLFCNFIEGALVVARHDRAKLGLGQLSQVLLNLAVAVFELFQLINRAGQFIELFCMLHDHIILVSLIHIHRPWTKQMNTRKKSLKIILLTSHCLDSVGTFENLLERVTCVFC